MITVFSTVKVCHDALWEKTGICQWLSIQTTAAMETWCELQWLDDVGLILVAAGPPTPYHPTMRVASAFKQNEMHMLTMCFVFLATTG